MKVIVEKTFANDEELVIIKKNFNDNDYVNMGDLIAQVEGSKSIIDILSPSSGYIKYVKSKTLNVGSCIAELSESMHGNDPVAETEETVANTGEKLGYKFSRTALEYIESQQIVLEDLKLLPGLVTKSDVIAAVQASITPNPALVRNTGPFSEKFPKINKTYLNFHKEIAVPASLSMSCEIPIGSKHDFIESKAIFRLWDVISSDYPYLFNYLNSHNVMNKGDSGIGYFVQVNNSLIPIKLDLENLSLEEFHKRKAEQILLAFKGKINIPCVTTLYISTLKGKHLDFHVPILPPNSTCIYGFALSAKKFTITVTYDHRCTDGYSQSKILGAVLSEI